MATKAQLINFIIEMYSEENGDPVSKSKLDALKKADLEEFIKARGAEKELEEWLSNQ